MGYLLQVKDLHVYFDTPRGVVKANSGVNLKLEEGTRLAIMGESGCGKTVLVLSLMRLQQPGRIVKGWIKFSGREVTKISEREMQDLRGSEIALIPQNHATALNPAYTVGQQLSETLLRREGKTGLWSLLGARPDKLRDGQIEAIFAVLQRVGFTEQELKRVMDSYPHQLSGGMQKRVMVAVALLLEPRLLIADEPTTALDRPARMEMVNLLGKLAGGITLLVVSHEIDTVQKVSEYLAVMYGGRIVEMGLTAEVLSGPRHPYTRMLLQSQQLRRGQTIPTSLEALDMVDFPAGCSFHPFCPSKTAICSQLEPVDIDMDGVMVSCHLYSGGAGACWR